MSESPRSSEDMSYKIGRRMALDLIHKIEDMSGEKEHLLSYYHGIVDTVFIRVIQIMKSIGCTDDYLLVHYTNIFKIIITNTEPAYEWFPPSRSIRAN